MRVALVTGGASGIGRATAVMLAALGDQVAVADLDRDAAETVAAELGGGAIGIGVDVTDPAQVDAMVARTVAELGRLDLAVNSAGVPSALAFVPDVSDELWALTIGVNLTGVFHSLRAEIPAMLDSGGGAIVNIASAAGGMGVPGMSAYAASKAGVISLTRSAALEYARKGVRVNAVLPGTVRTPMLEGFVGGNEDALKAMGKTAPMGRLATPEEIAGTIVFLCSDAASYMTGHALAADGGALAT